MHTIADAIPPICRRIQALAERDPRRGVVLARRALDHASATDLVRAAWAHYTLGWSLLCWERFDAARSELADALAAFETQGGEVAALRCRFALAIAGVLQSGRAGLERELVVLADQFAAAGLAIEATRCCLYLAVLFNILGRAHDAETALAQIEHAIAAAGALDRARWQRVRAVAAIAQGDAARALDLLRQAEAIFAADHQPLELAKSRFQHAWALLSQEDLDGALAYYEQAERTFIRLDLPQRQAWCAKNVGLLLTRRGRYDGALDALLRAIAAFRALGSAIDVAGCQLNLGNIYFYAGLWEAALAYYERAEASFAVIGVLGDRLVARRNRAIVYRIQGRYAEAAELLADAEARVRADGNQAELAAIWHEQAELMAHEGRSAQADVGYWRARDLFMAIGNGLGAADCAIEQGWLALRSGDLAQAQSHFAFAASIVTRHPYDLWRNEYGLARCAEAHGDLQAALTHYHVALETVSHLRQRLASEETSSRIYAQAAQLHADALRLAVAYGSPELAIEIGERQRTLAFKRMLSTRATALPAAYRAEHDRLHATINDLLTNEAANPDEHARALDATLTAYGELLLHARHSSSAITDEFERIPFDLGRLRAALDDAHGKDWTALVYMPGDQELLIGIVTAEDLAIVRVSYDAEFQHLIARAVEPAYRRYTYRDLPYIQGQTATRWEILRDLGDRLLPPALRARLHPDHRLLIVPAGPLHRLPWAALRLDDDWLVAHAILQIAPSLTTWPILAERRPENAAALLIGCSDFGERAPALPIVQTELTAIAERWPGAVDQLRDRRATRAAVLERSARGELAHYALLHLATHARMLPQRGLVAHVKLWDDDLLLPEIADLRLGGCLAVLSACEGAAADTLPGEESLSLSWAFLVAGAGGVLASLWRIDDDNASRFMAAFYAELRERRDPAVALARAQRSLIASDEEDNLAGKGPESWAGFLLTGSGRL